MSTRADNHDGSCRQVISGRHKGKWRVQYAVTDEFGRTRRLSKIVARQADGKQFLRDLRSGARKAEAQADREMTLREWIAWLAENDWPESLADRTIGDRLSRYKKYVDAIWGDVPLRKIDPLKVRAFYRKLKAEGVGQPTILALKRDLVRSFNQAVSPYQQVPMTWANPFCLSLQAAEPRDAVVLTPQMAKKALLSQKLGIERRAMLGLFLLAGVRLSEQMAMTRGQLLFDQNLIYVDRSIKFGRKGNQWVGLPKGKKLRLAVMCPTLRRLLLEVTAGMSDDHVIWGAFSENKARMKNLVYATWRTILKDAELPEAMTPHDCRLSHINWIEKLMPEVSSTTLKEHVGHAAQGVTEVNYTRPLTPAQDLLANHIERVVGLPIRVDRSPAELQAS